MKAIRVASYLAASDLLRREAGLWDVIVVLGREAELNPLVAETTQRHLVLRFDDIEFPVQGQQHVTSTHIQQALAFAKNSENLLVTCRAGQSRSVALAFVLNCQHFGLLSATEMLNPRRHVPNQLLIHEAALWLDRPDMEDAFHAWRARNAHIVLSDYYDEISDEVDALEASGVVNQVSVD
ncbi:hypothetical protein Pan97_12840 [Bremerella volcania]|uniref:Dual specificity phosphatase, catalytic domain n=1 Tax=Bremerella volcania TaxID=2527984 RepID=A0A518C4X4_9BACT|nr:dual specificity protein phosphatase family protein [Bremerella volcania]QDU74277.1 hypothetical protein Pan97_12840 [Bremerella volcania]